MSSSTPSLPEKSNIPQYSPLFRELIPVFAEKHPTFKWLYDHLVKQNPDDKKSAIDQNSDGVYLARSLLMAAYLTSGQRDDYENLVACQEKDRLTYKTFKRLSQQFEIFITKPDLYDLLELYIIISHISEMEIANEFACHIPKDEIVYNWFGLPYALIDKGLIPEANDLDLAELDTLRKAFKYEARAQKAFNVGEKITFNQDFTDSEQRIVYARVICDLAALPGPIGVSGSLALTESLARDFLTMLYRRNDPEYIGYLYQLRHRKKEAL